MMFFKNLSIRYKILIPVGVLGILLFGLGFMSIQSVNQITTASEEISGNYALKIEQLGDITSAYQTLRRVAFAHIVAQGDKELQQTLEEEATSLKDTISDLSEEYSAKLNSQDEKDRFAQFETNYTAYLEIYDKILTFSAGGHAEEASNLANVDLKAAGTALTEELNSMRSINKENLDNAV